MAEKEYLTWREKLEAAKKIVEVLEQTNTKDGSRDNELGDIMELAAKLFFHGSPRLLLKPFNCC